MTPAHRVTEHLTLVQVYPAHEPREDSPWHPVFVATRARLVRLGLMKCWIDNADCSLAHPIELHHNHIEEALIEDVDVERFIARFVAEHPEFAHDVTDDESFRRWVESEGNLLPLCKMHHTGVLGIHVIHYPQWEEQRYQKDGVDAPEEKVTG